MSSQTPNGPGNGFEISSLEEIQLIEFGDVFAETAGIGPYGEIEPAPTPEVDRTHL